MFNTFSYIELPKMFQIKEFLLAIYAFSSYLTVDKYDERGRVGQKT
jgi:hypothetical protein